MTKANEVARLKLKEVKSIHSSAVRTARVLKDKEKQIQNLFEKLEAINKEGNDILRKYRNESRSIREKLKRAETFYTEEFIPLQRHVKDRRSGIKKALAESESFRKDLERRKSRIQDVHTEFRKSFKSLQRTRVSIKSIEKNAIKDRKATDRTIAIITKRSVEAQKLVSKMNNNLKQTQSLHLKISKIWT